MAVSVNWLTRVILIPKSDLTLVGPGEVYELDLDWFRLQLKALEASEAGMPFLDTHNHNTTVTVGSITLARVIEIINGYTVTFEDGQYAVNLEGANSNVADEANVNQVSIRPNNSAGLVDTGVLDEMNELIERMQFIVESQRTSHSSLGGTIFYWDPANGLDANDGLDKDRACKTFAHIHDDLVVSGRHDVIFILSSDPTQLVITERITITKDWIFLRGPGRDALFSPTDDAADTITIDGAEGVEIDSLMVDSGTGPTLRDAVVAKNGAEFARLSSLWIEDGGGSRYGVFIDGGSNHHLECISAEDCVVGVYLDNVSAADIARLNLHHSTTGIVFRASGGVGSAEHNTVRDSVIDHNTLDIDVGVDVQETTFIRSTIVDEATIVDDGTDTIVDTRALARVQGLVGHNQVIEVLTRNTNQDPLTQRIRDYDTLANAQSDDGSTGLLDTYLTTATYTAGNDLATFEMVRVGS